MTHIVIVAHAPLASALKQVAVHAYADRASHVVSLDVAPQDTPESVEAQLRAVVQGPQEWLVLVDTFGATPCNAALRATDGIRSRVLAGVNVPMLWRALCYSDQPLDKLIGLASSGASHGILQVASTRPQNQSLKGAAHDSQDSQDQ